MKVVSCWYRGSGQRDHQTVAAVVAVERLGVVRGTPVLGPQLDLVEVEIRRLEVPLRRVDQVGVEGQSVELPRPVREFLDAGELVSFVLGEPRRIGEVLLGLREVPPQRVSGGVELLGGEKVFDDGEPVTTDFFEVVVGDPHRRSS